MLYFKNIILKVNSCEHDIAIKSYNLGFNERTKYLLNVVSISGIKKKTYNLI